MPATRDSLLALLAACLVAPMSGCDEPDPIPEYGASGIADAEFRQSRTHELVRDDVDTINVYIADDLRQYDADNYDESFTKAIRMAMSLWNEVEGLRFSFEYVTTPTTNPPTIAFVTMPGQLPCGTPGPAPDPNRAHTESDARARFPQGGLPGATIEVNPCILTQYEPRRPPRILRHIFMHELGHAVGFRHTDWATRESCGAGSPCEPREPDGAIPVPGTPPFWTGDPDSVFNACWNPG